MLPINQSNDNEKPSTGLFIFWLLLNMADPNVLSLIGFNFLDRHKLVSDVLG